MLGFINTLFRRRNKSEIPQGTVLFSRGSRLDPETRFINGFGKGCNLELGTGAWIDKNVELDISFASIRIGNGTFIHNGANIYGDVTFGDHCLVSKNLYASSGGHSISLPCYIRHCDRIAPNMQPSSPIIIHDDVWIGYNVFLKAGITIGKGAVVGALSAVTKNVPPYTVVGGVPARWIKNRYDYQPPPVICSGSKEHFPYFYSGFMQSGMQSSPEGYLVIKKKICLSVPNDFSAGEVIIKGHTLKGNSMSLNHKNKFSITPGSFKIKILLSSDNVSTEFESRRFIQLDVGALDAETRIQEAVFGT
jgi:acetyltransferase-like isoleucine patch superfamily enzyme